VTRSERLRTARIAVDLLGGDRAPAVVVDGALQACDADPDLQLHLVGPPDVADEVVNAAASHIRHRLTVLRVERAVGMADAPARAARPDTTVSAAVSAVSAGSADAVVSAGASGAIVTAAVLGLGRVSGVRKPALAAIVPSRSGPLMLLDVGASPDASAAILMQHAILGARYAAAVLDLAAPRIGLLSIGAERGKGDRLRRAADAALRHALPDYVGNVEGHDVPLGGRADVVVTDGFTGNVLLKGIEGAFALAGGVAADHVPQAAALLGVRGLVVVCHGAATGADIASGIALAARLHRTRVPAEFASVPLIDTAERGRRSATEPANAMDPPRATEPSNGVQTAHGTDARHGEIRQDRPRTGPSRGEATAMRRRG
jgi:glycerol-3-phosphate acyltransferase PlsX